MIVDFCPYKDIEELCAQSKEGTIAFIPVGCTEQHGPILPLGTDSIIATKLTEDLCTETAKRIPGIIYPTISYSPSRSNLNFSGSTSTSEDSFRAYVESICESVLAHQFRLIVFVCMHGPAEPSLTEIAFKLNHHQACSKSKMTPFIVLGVTKIWHVFQDILGDDCGKHADSKEFLMLYKILGESYFTPEKLQRLAAFDAIYKHQKLQKTVIIGIPTEKRSVDGVIGRPLPTQGVENFQRLADSLWNGVLNCLVKEIDEILTEVVSR